MTYDIIGNGILAYTTVYQILKKYLTVKLATISPQSCPQFTTYAMLNTYVELNNVSLLLKARLRIGIVRKFSLLWLSA